MKKLSEIELKVVCSEIRKLTTDILNYSIKGDYQKVGRCHAYIIMLTTAIECGYDYDVYGSFYEWLATILTL